MLQNFDYFGRQEKPSMTLCNPNLNQLYSINAAYDVAVKFKWNAQSELSFIFPREVNSTVLAAYDYVVGKRIVLLEGLGYFLIHNVSENLDGSVPLKEVTCFSLQSELIYKRIGGLSGTYLFYNADDPTDETSLMGVVMDLIPNWSIESIGTSLASVYRTFEIDDSNVYRVLAEEASKAYACVFDFDYLNKRISAISASATPAETDIFLSFDNLIENTTYEEVSEEIITCMYAYGGGDLTIRSVNPLGTNAVYNFTYYKTTDWMSSSLISAITAWETKCSSYASSYSASAILLGDSQTDLLTEQALLAEYEAELAADEQVRAARVQQGLDTTEIDNQIAIDTNYVNSQIIIVEQFTDTVASITVEMALVNTALNFENTDNFTAAQLLELHNFIFENSYKNDSIIITDIMTDAEIQEQSQQLYDATVEALEKASVPRYQISINSTNFLALREYSHFIDQLELGNQITVDTGKGYTIDATLLQYEFNYDDPEEFKIVLSNRQRLDDASFIFSDLIGNTIRASDSIDYNSNNWNDWKNNKATIIGKVITPEGIISYGIKSENLAGTIIAGSSLSIENLNSSTGSANISISKDGVTLRDPVLYDADGNIGVNLNLDLSGGGQLMFRNGIFIGGAGLEPGDNIITLEDLSGNSGVSFSTTSTYLANSLRVYINGLLQRKDYTYTESVDLQSFTMLDSIFATDNFVVEYVAMAS